jgi:hypothetical protein
MVGQSPRTREDAMVLTLKVTAQDTNKLKLSWSADNWLAEPYLVGRNLVESAAAGVRATLNEITDHYMRAPEPDYRPFLPRLAEAGAILSDVLFSVQGGGGDGADQAKEVIAAMQPRERMTVYSDASAHVPWNFVYRGADVDRLRDASGTIDDFRDFWSSVFSINTRFNRTEFMADRPRARANFRVLYILHKDQLNKAKEHLESDEAACLDKLLRYEVGEAIDWETSFRKWSQIEQNDSVVYVFGHSDGHRIALDDGNDPKYQLDAARILHRFKKKKGTPSATIWFVNGCRSGAGDMDNGFLAVTSSPGCHGFIGTEAQVPNDFATRYGIAFMHHLCEDGWCVQDTYDALRERLFPLSLIYSSFAHARFRIEAQPARAA